MAKSPDEKQQNMTSCNDDGFCMKSNTSAIAIGAANSMGYRNAPVPIDGKAIELNSMFRSKLK